MPARVPTQPRDATTDASDVFVVDIDGRPTLALRAPSLELAQQCCRDSEILADLMGMTSDGVPICEPRSELVARAAAPEEIAVFQRAIGRAPTSHQSAMVFLIKLDGITVVARGPSHD